MNKAAPQAVIQSWPVDSKITGKKLGSFHNVTTLDLHGLLLPFINDSFESRVIHLVTNNDPNDAKKKKKKKN